MLTLLDGPAAGDYAVKRAPFYLRAVVNPIPRGKDNNGKDVLDQLDDEPRPCEKVYVYRQVKYVGTYHLCCRGKGKSASGWYPIASYCLMAEIDGEKLRDTTAWREWCARQTDLPVNMETGAIGEKA